MNRLIAAQRARRMAEADRRDFAFMRNLMLGRYKLRPGKRMLLLSGLAAFDRAI